MMGMGMRTEKFTREWGFFVGTGWDHGDEEYFTKTGLGWGKFDRDRDEFIYRVTL